MSRPANDTTASETSKPIDKLQCARDMLVIAQKHSRSIAVNTVDAQEWDFLDDHPEKQLASIRRNVGQLRECLASVRADLDALIRERDAKVIQ